MIPGYTKFKRQVAMELRSLYAKRMYELMCKWQDKNGFTMNISELKDMLAVTEKYAKYSAFKKFVLESYMIYHTPKYFNKSMKIEFRPTPPNISNLCTCDIDVTTPPPNISPYL